jgi:UDP-N-acetylmuramoylalanine--D-glutamate ligase
MRLNGTPVLVLGLGESGLAMARWLAHQGARVRVADSRASPPNASALARCVPDAELTAGSFADSLLDGVRLLALSPGLSSEEPVVRAAVSRGIPVTGEIELFAQAIETLGWRSGVRLVAITGTNGKTTVTSMVGQMCRRAGLDAVVAGNIGPAALAALLSRIEQGGRPEAWVLELSSFQLETTRSLAADAAVVLNVSDDHLDRYPGVDAYAAAKARIYAGDGVQVINREDPRVAAMRLPGRRALSFGPDAPAGAEDFGVLVRGGESWLARGTEQVLPAAALPLAGAHNIANALAALALCRAIGLPMAPLVVALTAFEGLPHRLERIARIAGVDFYDDSKGTNVAATVAALAGVGRPTALIAGGDGKGQDFAPLASAVATHARAVVLIGRDAPRIAACLADTGVPLLHAADMAEAVARAHACVSAGESVLLSPACASFDMYRDYAHRAEAFAEAVRRLARSLEVPAR